MSRKREWFKFGSLVGVTLVLAVVFISVVDLPKRSVAQQPASQVIKDRPAPIAAAAQPVADLGNAFTAVAEAVRPSVVYIASERRAEARGERQQLPAPFDRFFRIPGDQGTPQPQAGSGSGFLISPDGYIVTNNHVVEGFDRISVQLFDKRQFDATVVGRDPDTDVAVIKIDASSLPAASLGNSDSLRVGEWVLAIGNPLGDQFSFTVTAGIVSGRGRVLRGLQQGNQWAIGDFIQTDAAINPGNSGGPLVNIRGQVVGMNAAIASETGFYAGYSFAIPINLVRTVADQLIRDGKVTRAALGITVTDADAEDAEYVGMKEVRGVLVQGFASEDSPAQRAGLAIGDVIVAIDGKPVDYVAQLQQIVGFKRPGETVDVTIMRAGGERKTLQVRLIRANEQPTEVADAGGSDTETAPGYESKLGVAVQDLTSQLASQDDRLTDENRGPVITDVDPNGPARHEGFVPLTLQRGWMDVITHVDSRRVTSVSELERALASVKPGAIVSLQVYQIRGDQAASRVVRLRAGGD